VASVEFAHAERPVTVRVARGHEFMRRQHEERVRASQVIEAVYEAFLLLHVAGLCDEVNYHLRVHTGLEYRAVALVFPSQSGRVDEISVVGYCDLPAGIVCDEGLSVLDAARARRGIAHVPDRRGISKFR